MARKRKSLPELQNVEISGVAAEGKSIAKVALNDDNKDDQLVIFIPFGAPGDLANIKIDKKKKRIVFVYNAGIFDVGTVVESHLLNAHMFE